MCGIAGIISFNEPLDLNRMTNTLNVIQHRGPDAEGVWISDNNKVILGHRRLSIIDLTESGNQPMVTENNEIIIVFNGEIYNYKEIKSILEKAGTCFHTTSDTEVIIESYRYWGYDCLEKFNGMFAFTIFDIKKNILFCARDRAGEKPFFYSYNSNEFIFCSEIKGILASSNFNFKINKAGLDCYLNEGYVPGSLCIVENISKLEPAHAMILDLNNFTFKNWKFWDLPDFCVSNSFYNEDLILRNLENLLEDSVSKQLIADVPVGILLSGGVDSSLITAMSARVSSNISTFTVRFPGYSKYDETEHARLISNYFGTKHHELDAEMCSVDLLSKLAEQFDEPIIDSSMIPTYLVSNLIRNYCKVALGGDGGDELFGGYSHYDKLLSIKQLSNYCPLLIRKYFSEIIYNKMPIGFTGRKWVKAFGLNFNNELPLIANYFDELERSSLLSDSIYNIEIADNYRENRVDKNLDLIQKATRTDFCNYLPEDILVKVDRASMLNSLEIRAPFLDHRLIEYAFREIPSNLKTLKSNKKIILKKLAKKILPPNFDYKRKQGFSIPLNIWLQQKEWKDFFTDNLLSNEQTIFNHDFIKNILKNQVKYNNSGEHLFGLLMFELWRKKYNLSL
jgi:asparagine synthase (glutamine-hydrolysing)